MTSPTSTPAEIGRGADDIRFEGAWPNGVALRVAVTHDGRAGHELKSIPPGDAARLLRELSALVPSASSARPARELRALKLLVSIAALLAAALAALIFPEMKSTLLLIPFALLALAFTSGCGSTSAIERALRKLPDGQINKVTVSSGNLGVSATVTGDSLVKEGNKISAERINATLNTPWSGTTVFNLEGWSADVSPQAHKPKKTAVPAQPQQPGAAGPEPVVPSAQRDTHAGSRDGQQEVAKTQPEQGAAR